MNTKANSKQITHATLWTALEFALGTGLSILFIPILARLLTPEDFGTFALLAIFVGLATALVESGFGLALIQKQDATDDEKSTVYWIGLGTATIIALGLAGAAPLISGFFRLPVLVPLTQIIAATVWISGFGVVHRALLIKRLGFRQLTTINISAVFVSGIISVGLASAGFGVYSLAWQGFVAALLRSSMLRKMDGWQPRLVFSTASAKRLFGFGGYLLASNIIYVIYSKSYTLLIGKFFGMAELGYFNRAESTSQMVTGLVVQPISRVAFPAFSQMQGDLVRMRNGLVDAVRISMLFNAITMFMLAAMAKPFVLTLLGPQWEHSVPLLQVLCLATLLLPLQMLNLQALMALGRSDLFFWLEVIKKSSGVGILIVMSHYGVIGIAWGIVFAEFFSFIINSWYSGKYLSYGPVRQLIQIIPPLAIGLTGALAARLAMYASAFDSQLFQLLIGVGAAAATIAALVGLAWLLNYDLTGHLSQPRGEAATDKPGAAG